MSAQNRFDRRALIVTAGTCVIAASLPAMTWAVRGDAVAPNPVAGRLAEWTIDDMWGVYPRPAQEIGYGRRRAPLAVVAEVGAQFG